MPCQPPKITPIDDECCFNCYSVGRAPYLNPIAIVLHEYDGHIEALNNELERCCNREKGCHTSFHYGIGNNGDVYNWVDPANTAWSFDVTSQFVECGVCDWVLASQQGQQDPNLYTINIAIATGTSSIARGRRGPLNIFSVDQYEASVQLVGWLAETYGITVNQNTIWRHCDELKDFPSACPGECTFADFLQAVQDCIDSETLCLPGMCSDFCECPVVPGSPEFIFGADENCDTCGRYRLDLCDMIQGLNAGTFDKIYCIGVDDQGECVAMEVDPNCNTTETVCSAFGLNSNGVPGFYSVKEQLEDRTAGVTDSLVPATDRVVKLDAENDNVVFTLVPPTEDCCPKDFWIKRIDCNSDNSVVIDGGGATIDGDDTVTLDTPGPHGSMGETLHIYWDGSQWIIL